MTFQESLAALYNEGYVHVPQQEGLLLNASPVKTIDLSDGFPGQFFSAPFTFNDHCAHDRSPSDLQTLRDVLWN